MVSKTEQIKNSSIIDEQGDNGVHDTYASAHKMQLSLAQEHNRHKETTQVVDVGFMGRIFGNGKNAPIYIAFFVLITALILYGILTGIYTLTPIVKTN